VKGVLSMKTFFGSNIKGIEALNVITDLEMPGMDGWTFALNIKKEAPKTPVIMVTSMNEESFMQNVKENCVDIVMFKPFRIKNLGENITRMLGPYLEYNL